MSGTSESYPLEIKDLGAEETSEVFKHFSDSVQDGFVRIGSKGYFYPNGMKEIAPKIYNMALRPDDIWVLSFPKSGTTLIQELVWLIANDFDYATAEAVPLVARFPFLEMSMFIGNEKIRSIVNIEGAEEANEFMLKSVDHVANMKSPRFIKSHLALSMQPPKLLDTCKVVYIARDPRDVAVSYYHHDNLFKYMGYTGDLKQHWRLLIKDLLYWTPLFDNVKESWEKRNHQNMLFLFYEDALKDLPSTVKRVANFLGKTVTEEQMSRLCEHLSFDSFKKNKSVNMEIFADLTDKDASPFIRKGKAGGWRENFDEEMTRQAEQWMADNLRDTDLRYPTV